MRIVSASDARAHLPELAQWHHAEWAHLFDGWDENDALAELQAHADAPGELPNTWVAVDDDGAVMGSVSVVLEDAPELTMIAGPWLASLFVVPCVRGQGVGKTLVRAALDGAAMGGASSLVLFTPGQRAFYERLGWAWEAGYTVRGQSVDVLRAKLTP